VKIKILYKGGKTKPYRNHKPCECAGDNNHGLLRSQHSLSPTLTHQQSRRTEQPHQTCGEGHGVGLHRNRLQPYDQRRHVRSAPLRHCPSHSLLSPQRSSLSLPLRQSSPLPPRNPTLHSLPSVHAPYRLRRKRFSGPGPHFGEPYFEDLRCRRC